MILTIVEFRAFDRDSKEPFLHSDMKRIEKALQNICITYVITAIKQVDLSKVEMNIIDYKPIE